jgi:hypothetical protein
MPRIADVAIIRKNGDIVVKSTLTPRDIIARVAKAMVK